MGREVGDSRALSAPGKEKEKGAEIVLKLLGLFALFFQHFVFGMFSDIVRINKSVMLGKEE